MKHSGLKNRFSPEVRGEWIFWYSCMLCGLNKFDALHHIISSSSRHWKEGKHNESIYNSCPIHNELHPSAQHLKTLGRSGYGITKRCHIGNDDYLQKDMVISALITKVKKALDDAGYIPNENDRQFLFVYRHLYTPGGGGRNPQTKF